MEEKIIKVENLPPECFTPEGNLLKVEAAKHLPSMSNTEIADCVYFIDELTKSAQNTYYRLEILGSNFGLVYKYTSDNIEKLYADLLDALSGVATEIVAFGWANTQETGVEIWGRNGAGEGVILYFYPYDEGIVEV